MIESKQNKASEIEFYVVSTGHPEFRAVAEELSRLKRHFVWECGLFFRSSEAKYLKRILPKSSRFYSLIEKRTLTTDFGRRELKRNSVVIIFEIIGKLLIHKTFARFKESINQMISLAMRNKIDKEMQKRPRTTFVLSNEISIRDKASNRIVVLASSIHPLSQEEIRIKLLASNSTEFAQSGFKKTFSRQLAVDRASLIVANCTFSGRTYYKYSQPWQGIEIVSLGPVFVNNQENVLSLKSKEQLIFLYVGRMVFEKGIYSLMQAFKDVPSSFALKLCGAATQVELDKMSQFKNENIEIIPNPTPNQIKHQLESASVIVSASYMEGFGITLLEGMSHGCIPVFTRNSFASDLMKDSVFEPFLIDPFDINQLSRTILNLENMSANEVIRFQLEAMKLASTYSFETYGKQVVELLDDL